MTNDRNGTHNPTCGDYEEKLSAYVLGESDVLSDGERAALETHLESCERCREEAALLRRTVEAVLQASAVASEATSEQTTGLEADRRDVVLSEAAEAVAPARAPRKVSRTATAGGSVFVRRASWALAAAVLVASLVPFLVDRLGDAPSSSEKAGTEVALRYEPTEDGATVPESPALVTLRAEIGDGREASRPVPPAGPGAAGGLPGATLVVEEFKEAAPAPDRLYRLPRPEEWAEVASRGEGKAVDQKALDGLGGVSDAGEVRLRREGLQSSVELATKLASASRGLAPERTDAAGLGTQPAGGVDAGRRYSVTVAAPAVPGADGVDGPAGGSGGRYLSRGAGAEGQPRAGEPVYSPIITGVEHYARDLSNTAAARTDEPESRRRLSVRRKAGSRTASGAPEGRGVAVGVVVESESVSASEFAGVNQTGDTSKAPAIPLHYPKDLSSSLQVLDEPAAAPEGAGERSAESVYHYALGVTNRSDHGVRTDKSEPAGEAASPETVARDRDVYLSARESGAAPTRGGSARGRSREVTRAAGSKPASSASSRGYGRSQERPDADPAGTTRSSRSSRPSKVETSPSRPAVRARFEDRTVALAEGGAAAKDGERALPEQQLQKQLGEETTFRRLPEVERTRRMEEVEKLEQKKLADALNKHKAPDASYKKYEAASDAEGDEATAADENAIRKRSPSSTAIDPRQLVEEYCRRLAPRPGETPDMMFFRYWGTNPFVEANVDNQSTFAVDVDTASYTLLRKYLTDRGVLPPREAIRTEEFINYFKYEYPPPAEGQAFAVDTEMAPSPFGHEPEYQLLKVGIKGREVTNEKRKRCALVFVVDTSGSMARETRLELVKDGLRLLVREVDEGDTIGIVAFDRDARTILEPTPADQKEKILDAINTLQPRRNTNVDAGLRMGYEMAARNLIDRGSNRVLLLSDGVANTGVTDVNGMLSNVQAHRQRGIFLTCVGVGMGNHNDTLLEQLADRGDGQCVYVDRLEEAQKVFVENLAGTLETIARDVKIQVEFDKEKVLRYRLLGYENRAVADSAFRDDTVDAGEVGAGHEVTAVYELKCAPGAEGRIATVRVRHLKVDSREPVEIEHVVDTSSRRGTYADTSPRFKLSALAGEFAEILRGSYWARGSDLGRVAAMTQDLLGEGGMKLGSDPEVVELAALMFRAVPLIEARRKSEGELAQVMDALKENTHLRTRVETLRLKETEETTRYLRDLQEQNEELRHRLERLLDERISGGR